MATGSGDGSIPNVHSNTDSSNKTLLKSQALYKYILDTTVLPNEPESMRELRLLTDKHERYIQMFSYLDPCEADGDLGHLDALPADERNHGAFDFAFVDADKPNYVKYHKQLLRLVRVGGVIVYDNTLWHGTVALPPETTMSDHDRRVSAAARDLNARLAADSRVEVCQLAVADGVTICCRVV